jgi:hypothetical protein
MAEQKKTILQEAMLEYSQFQEAIKANSKEILRSVMNEEIEGVIKEAAEEADYDEEDVDDTEEKDETPELDVDADSEGEEDEMGVEPEMGIEMSDDESGQDSEEIEAEPEMGALDLDSDMDLTTSPDEEVIQVFKKLSGNDEIEVVSDSEVTIKDPQSGAEYHVKLKGAKTGGNVVDVEAEPEMGIEAEPEMDSENSPFENEDEDEDDEMVYEITLDDEDEDDLNENAMVSKPVTGIVTNTSTFKEVPTNVGGDKEISKETLKGGFDDDKTHAPEAKKHVKGSVGSVTETEEEVNSEEEELEEVSRTLGLGDETKGGLPKMRGSKSEAMKESVDKYNKLLVEAKRLKAENIEFKKQNGEFREALLEVKSKFAETQVFSANLAYVAKLFMEHTTSKTEKQGIIKRFDDSVTTIKESQKLYKTIKTELEGKPTITESVDSKINKTVDSSSTAKLNESTVYVDASTKRIIDLIKRVENPTK